MRHSFLPHLALAALSLPLAAQAQQQTPGGGGAAATPIVANSPLSGGTITSTGTVGLTTPLSTGNGGTGTATPGEVAGAGITLTGSFPTQTITNSGTTAPGGTTGQVQVNSSGVLAGTACVTSSGTLTTLTCPTTVTSTGSITVVAGGLFINGVSSAFPTFGATGEGALILQTGNGVVIGGSGTSVDLELLSTAGAACTLPHNTLNLTCASLSSTGTINATGNITSAASMLTPINTNSVNSHAWGRGVAITVSGTGLGTSPTVTNQNGSYGGMITTGSSPVNASFTITLAAATNGWGCFVNDETSNASNVIGQLSHTTTTAVMQAYSRTTGLAQALTAADVLTYHCAGF